VPQFPVVLRGYDRAAVDTAIARAAEGLAASNRALRHHIAGELRGSAFMVSLRGYDRAQVDAYLTQVIGELERG
jgi:DivIVA domain-containing protein